MPKVKDLPPGIKYHFFLSHAQNYGQDKIKGLHEALKAEFGVKCWRDMEQEPNEHEMKKGVHESMCFLILLTKGIMARPWCQKEMGWALDMGKKFVVVWVSDVREAHGGMSIQEHMEQCKTDFPRCAQIFTTAVAIQYQVGPGYDKVMYQSIMERSGLLRPRADNADIESPPLSAKLAF
jgi:hypothetical protein